MCNSTGNKYSLVNHNLIAKPLKRSLTQKHNHLNETTEKSSNFKQISLDIKWSNKKTAKYKKVEIRRRNRFQPRRIRKNIFCWKKKTGNRNQVVSVLWESSLTFLNGSFNNANTVNCVSSLSLRTSKRL